MLDMESTRFDSPFGPVILRVANGKLYDVDLQPGKKQLAACVSPMLVESQLLHKQLGNYFSSAKALEPGAFKRLLETSHGTEFQRKVWKQLLAIPPGKVKTYGDIAKALNSCAQAVGNACRANPVPLFVPCHRVIAKSGIGGFAGHISGKPLSIKKWLLQHEGVDV